MSETVIAISEFKATCLKVLDQVRRTGKPVLVTRRGKPIALVTPPPPTDGRAWLGRLAGSAQITGNVIEPAADQDDWESLER